MSWKTTTLGICTIISAVSTAAVTYFKSGILPDFGLLISAITAGIGLIKARDNDKTSEQVGAK